MESSANEFVIGYQPTAGVSQDDIEKAINIGSKQAQIDNIETMKTSFNTIIVKVPKEKANAFDKYIRETPFRFYGKDIEKDIKMTFIVKDRILKRYVNEVAVEVNK